MKHKGLITFLKTRTPIKDLKVALKVIQEFKQCETLEEYVQFTFNQWVRLEQLEDYLKLITRVSAETVTDTVAVEYFKKHRRKKCWKE